MAKGSVYRLSDGNLVKVCKSCGKPKAVSEFRKCMTTFDGYSPACIECQGDVKHCLICGRYRKRSEFRIDSTRADGLQGYCKRCQPLVEAVSRAKRRERC